MIVKLSVSQFDCLHNCLFKGKEAFQIKPSFEKEDKFAVIKIDEDIADEIRDWASEELQTKGFNIDYRLTSEGEILQGIIDAFYVK